LIHTAEHYVFPWEPHAPRRPEQSAEVDKKWAVSQRSNRVFGAKAVELLPQGLVRLPYLLRVLCRQPTHHCQDVGVEPHRHAPLLPGHMLAPKTPHQERLRPSHRYLFIRLTFAFLNRFLDNYELSAGAVLLEGPHALTDSTMQQIVSHPQRYWLPDQP
jgi:hypothetical protein